MGRRKSNVVQLRFDDNDLAQNLFGPQGAHLRSLENKLGIAIHEKSGELALEGEIEKIEFAQSALDQLYTLLKKGYPVTGHDVEAAVRVLTENRNASLHDLYLDSIFVPAKRRVIYPKSMGQKLYVEAIRKYDLVFGIGPAGTGKTYLAMAMAVTSLLKGQVERIVLTRPAIEAGEKLGFLPGSLVEKVNPYLTPLYDAMHDMLDFERTTKMLEKGEIEVAPLAFMRGRTLSQAFVILDEAQNCTKEQMKMFLTRIGQGSKAVITGDPTQIDLPRDKVSGLMHAVRVLEKVQGLCIHTLSPIDVVRHPLVQAIVEAYENDEKLS
ncbi:MAG: phosphate starvation-inducible protein PhoH [Deltaproteobacteria bacterium GWA2_45_12]|nr:MAG: phosphate starvation-inducible protein PhoH [Deltaproteobacteria bacterium GWA2_45_12]